MLIELEYKNSLLESINSEAINHEIILGRGSQCEWRIPKEDGVISNQHVKIFKKGSALWIEDMGSTNGMYLKDKRIERRKLSLGDQITMGDCVVSVSAPRGGGADGPSSIVVLSGLKKRTKMMLESPGLTIGSGPSSGLLFPSDLVSREHAIIHVREDRSCWIEDLGSKNGTQVNEVTLPRDKERLLKEGDRIAISQYEMLFQDGMVVRKASQVWLKVAVLAATLAIAAAGYQAYLRIQPSSEDYLTASRELARQELFKEAEEELAKADISRGHKQAELEISMLRSALSNWSSTQSGWEEASAALSKGDWVKASRQLARLQTVNKEAWSWNDQASTLKEQAQDAKGMLDALLRAQAAQDRTDLNMTELAVVDREAEKQMDRLSANSTANLQPLREALGEVRSDIGGLLSHNKKLEQAVAMLDGNAPPYARILADLRAVKDAASGAVRHKAEQFIEPITGLSISYKRLVQAVQATRNLDFKEARSVELELPSVDACSIDPHISKARINIENMDGHLSLAVSQLEGLHGRLAPYLSSDGALPEPVRLLSDAAVMQKVLACDCLELPLPNRKREPNSMYDRVLGVEELYTTLRVFPNEPDSMLLAHMPFEPALRQARDFCKEVSLFNSFLNDRNNSWLVAGKMKAFLQSINQVNTVRGELVKQWLAEAAKRSGREALILGAMAHMLAEDPSGLTLKGVPLTGWVSKEHKALKIKLMDLDKKRGRLPPSQQATLRDEILSLGLPGDPTMRKMWSLRDNSKSAAGTP